MNEFRGRTAVITGGASGFGLECSRLAARLGMNVVMADVQPDALDLSAREVEGLGARVLPFRVDVSQPDQVQALAEATKARFGVPQFVFNNAGVVSGGLVWENSLKDWQWVLGVNLWGVVNGVRSFTPMMLEAAKHDFSYQGHIVNTASMAGLVNPPNMGVYNVSKHAVVSLTETLYQDLALVTDQVHAHVLCPFFVPTGIHSSQRNRPEAMKDAGAQPTKSQLIAQAMADKAISGGRVTASDVAAKVFEALRHNHFYIYSHPNSLGSVQARLEDVVQARNPSDPFKDKPEVGAQLRSSLRGG
jgi:NAD(P)-dependent dehydrogenase (short-subunit alcohol dehydrogenase family)